MFKKLLSSLGSFSLKFSKQPGIDGVLADSYTLAICCIIKDENDYLEEWLTYHLKAGVEHFFIYDNGSRVPIYDTLKALDLLKHATVTRIPGKAMQIKAYNHCLKNFGHTTQWIGFIDIDEFILALATKGNIIDFLKDYTDYGALGINWLMFGSSGHVQKPGKPQLESFLLRSDETFSENSHIKNIVQPKYVEASLGAHTFSYKPGKFCVNENFARVDGSFTTTVTVTKIRINHYYCRSFEEYEAKIKRGYGDTSKKRTLAEFHHHDRDANKVKDTTILEIFQK